MPGHISVKVLAAIRNAVSRDACALWYFSSVFPDARATTPEKPRQDPLLEVGERGNLDLFASSSLFIPMSSGYAAIPDSRRVRGNPREGSSPTGAI